MNLTFDVLVSLGLQLICPDIAYFQVDAMDVAPNGKLYVVGGRDGKLYVGKTGEGHEPSRPLKLEGHVGDVLSCSFVSGCRLSAGLKSVDTSLPES